MDIIQNRIEAFVKLGQFLSQFSREKIEKKEDIPFNDLFFDGFKHQMKIAQENNAWFVPDNLLFACESWTKALCVNNLTKWTTAEKELAKNDSKTVAVIMAGNIPLVGFHDFLSVLIAGHDIIVKQSSNDKHLLPFLAKYIEHVYPPLKGKMTFTEEKLNGF